MMTYFDESGENIRPELLNEEARSAAEKFIVIGRNGKPQEADSIKNSQLRRFFNEFKSLERRLDQLPGDPEVEFLRVKPMVKMANAKVEYAKARKVVPQTSVKWLQGHVKAIDTAKDFKAFLLHFEAVVGFCYGLNPKD
jgi:CRISPR-associated protein Csm2